MLPLLPADAGKEVELCQRALWSVGDASAGELVILEALGAFGGGFLNGYGSKEGALDGKEKPGKRP